MWSALLPCSLVIVIAACGPPGRPNGSPDAGISDAPPRAEDPPTCYEAVTDVDVALEVQIEQSCAIWNSLGQLPGKARVTRSATTLSIDFGDGVVFAGTLTGDDVNLVYEHPHPFSDGCGWKATETIVGRLDPRSCAFALSYDYVESVVMSDGSCSSPCSAQADVTLDLKPIIL